MVFTNPFCTILSHLTQCTDKHYVLWVSYYLMGTLGFLRYSWSKVPPSHSGDRCFESSRIELQRKDMKLRCLFAGLVVLLLVGCRLMGMAEVALLTHEETLATDEYGNGYIFGTVVVTDGCLRLDASSENFRHYTMLLVWPPGYTLGKDAEGLYIEDSEGRAALRPGDDARFTGTFPGEKYRDVFYRIDEEAERQEPQWVKAGRKQQIAEWREKIERPWQERLGTGCSGPFLLIGDDATAVSPKEVDSHVVPGPIFFPVSGHLRGFTESMAARAEGQLMLDGECLRVGDSLAIWPPGFKLHIGDDQVEVLNGGGKTIARVGDHLRIGGGWPGTTPFQDNPTCLGPFLQVGTVKVLPPDLTSTPTPTSPPTPVPVFDISREELQAIYEGLGFTFGSPAVDPHGREYVAGVGPDDDPALASTIRLFGSSDALHWVDLRLSAADPMAEDTADRLWQYAGALFRVLDPVWSDPKEWFTKTIRLMDMSYMQVQTLGDGGGAYFTVETGESPAGKMTHPVMAHPVSRR